MTGNTNGGSHQGQPPKKFQFQKGASGNPKGRPKGTRNLKSDLAEELAEKIPIREDGRTRRISKQRAMIKGAVAKAIQGDQRALANIVSLAIKLMGDEVKEDMTAGLTDAQKMVMQIYKERVRAELLAELKNNKNKETGHD